MNTLLSSPEFRSAGPHNAASMVHVEALALSARNSELALTEAQKTKEIIRVHALLMIQTTWSKLAILDGKIAGYALGYPQLKNGLPQNDHHLDTLMVNPRYWRQGIAGALIDRAFAELSSADVTSLNLWTGADNVQARALYEKKGFSVTDRERVHHVFGEQQVEYLQHIDRT